jgi:DNA-binding NarL/FixJ family response regulator
VCIRVLIADDQPSARRSLNALLTAMRWSAPNRAEQPIPAGFFSVEVVGIAENGLQAVEQVQALYPDVVVMDLPLHTVPASEATMNGLATIQMIKSRWPATRIVVLTMYATSRTSVLGAGADAFLLKGCSTKELMEAVMPRPADELG